MTRTPLNQILVGDARRVLARLPDGFVDCVVTSPPYFRLRNYQHPGQLGLEARVDQWVERLREVFRELQRVLVPSGSLWLNLSDTYATGKEGAAPKSLLLAPERVALALLADGWVLRNKVIWSKRNPMPTAVGDRLACTYEVVYFAVKQRRYFFDLDAVRVPHTSTRAASRAAARAWVVPEAWRGPELGSNGGLDRLKTLGLSGHPLGKNPGDVWQLPTASYRGAHHAVFPVGLARRPIEAACPERRCARCRAPWQRRTVRSVGALAVRGELGPTCSCRAQVEPGVVLDPFIGSGTSAIAARQLGRDWLGIELNPDLAAQARKRIRQEPATTQKRAA
jgi:site-specific DNA-methyltransferase (adenine-specific)